MSFKLNNRTLDGRICRGRLQPVPVKYLPAMTHINGVLTIIDAVTLYVLSGAVQTPDGEGRWEVLHTSAQISMTRHGEVVFQTQNDFASRLHPDLQATPLFGLMLTALTVPLKGEGSPVKRAAASMQKYLDNAVNDKVNTAVVRWFVPAGTRRGNINHIEYTEQDNEPSQA